MTPDDIHTSCCGFLLKRSSKGSVGFLCHVTITDCYILINEDFHLVQDAIYSGRTEICTVV